MNLSGDGTYPFNDDIDKETRSGSWDIGFDEYILPTSANIRKGTLLGVYNG